MTTVFVKDKVPVEIALRKLNKKLLKCGLVSEIRKHLTYSTPLMRRNRKKLLAKRRMIRRKDKLEF